MWVRVQVTATQTRLRVWGDGDVEPTTWQRTATGPTLPAPPDLITIFANATNANQGLEVDFITFTEGCAASTFVDTFDRVVDPATGATAGWGTGPMGSWTYSWGSSSGTFAVDGASAIHTAAAPGSTNVALDLAALLGPAPRSDLELLVRWRVDTAPIDNAWTFEAYFTNELGLADDCRGGGAGLPYGPSPNQRRLHDGAVGGLLQFRPRLSDANARPRHVDASPRRPVRGLRPVLGGRNAGARPHRRLGSERGRSGRALAHV